jgi:hypothetical protein
MPGQGQRTTEIFCGASESPRTPILRSQDKGDRLANPGALPVTSAVFPFI